jgi:hypothetical protein
VFTDRLEIIRPGHRLDSLTPEQIRADVSNRRNKVLAKHAAKILPYRGLGMGVPRALDARQKIDLRTSGRQTSSRRWCGEWRPRKSQRTSPGKSQRKSPEKSPGKWASPPM